eukprot:698590-Hanusia_phi.AAC.1
MPAPSGKLGKNVLLSLLRQFESFSTSPIQCPRITRLLLICHDHRTDSVRRARGRNRSGTPAGRPKTPGAAPGLSRDRPADCQSDHPAGGPGAGRRCGPGSLPLWQCVVPGPIRARLGHRLTPTVVLAGRSPDRTAV